MAEANTILSSSRDNDVSPHGCGVTYIQPHIERWPSSNRLHAPSDSCWECTRAGRPPVEKSFGNKCSMTPSGQPFSSGYHGRREPETLPAVGTSPLWLVRMWRPLCYRSRLGRGTMDGVDASISFAFSQNQTDPGLLVLVLDISRFSSSFQYDPDFSVVLPSRQQEDSSSTGNLLPLSLIALLLVPVTLVTIVIVITPLAWLPRLRTLSATRKGTTGNVTLPLLSRMKKIMLCAKRCAF